MTGLSATTEVSRSGVSLETREFLINLAAEMAALRDRVDTLQVSALAMYATGHHGKDQAIALQQFDLVLQTLENLERVCVVVADEAQGTLYRLRVGREVSLADLRCRLLGEPTQSQPDEDDTDQAWMPRETEAQSGRQAGPGQEQSDVTLF